MNRRLQPLRGPARIAWMRAPSIPVAEALVSAAMPEASSPSRSARSTPRSWRDTRSPPGCVEQTHALAGFGYSELEQRGGDFADMHRHRKSSLNSARATPGSTSGCSGGPPTRDLPYLNSNVGPAADLAAVLRDTS